MDPTLLETMRYHSDGDDGDAAVPDDDDADDDDDVDDVFLVFDVAVSRGCDNKPAGDVTVSQ